MRLLDLFCKAGGAAEGYHRAGFAEIVGVDIAPQKHYPFEFVLGDALEYCAAHGHEFDAIHASPPCQFGSEATPIEDRAKHPNLIPQTRATLLATGKPYIIENVENVRRHLNNPTLICGSMLGLLVWRHRYFETWPLWILSPASCQHVRQPVTVHTGSHSRKTWIPVLASGGGDGARDKRNLYRPRERVDTVRTAMEIDWMVQSELTEAIPPAFTEYIGRFLIAYLEVNGKP